MDRQYKFCLESEARMRMCPLGSQEYEDEKYKLFPLVCLGEGRGAHVCLCGRRENLDQAVRDLFNQTAAAKKVRQQVPTQAFGLQHFLETTQAKIIVILSTIFLAFAAVLEWTEEYPGAVQKPIPVRRAGVAFKVVALVLGIGNWGRAGGGGWVLFLVKGIVTALEIPVKGFLIFKYVPNTTLASPTDWFNLLGPTILAIFIAIMDTVRVWQGIVGGDDGGESNEFLPYTRLGDTYDALTTRPYPGRGLDRTEKLMLMEALLWKM